MGTLRHRLSVIESDSDLDFIRVNIPYQRIVYFIYLAKFTSHKNTVSVIACHSECVQCSSDISEPKYTCNTRHPNMRIRVCIYANTRIHIRKYAYTVYARMPH